MGIFSKETEAQRGLGLGPKPHSLMVAALGKTVSPQNIFPFTQLPPKGQPGLSLSLHSL